MKHHKNKGQVPQNLKNKFRAALSMLLVATLLLGTTSYAWFVMATAPEATGLTTNVGANGALEIALLNTETRQDMSKIPTKGGSLAKNDPNANHSWGNIVDLSYTNYGLQDFILWPSRMNVIRNGDSYKVDSGLLTVPTYGYDGRIVELTDKTVTGTYDGSKFVSALSQPGYGVRAVGTAEMLSSQAAALALAKANINVYRNSANSKAALALDGEEGLGQDLLLMLVDRTITYNESNLNTLKKLTTAMKDALADVDLALRQGLIAYAASNITDKDAFKNIKDSIQDGTKTMDDLETLVKEALVAQGKALPEQYSTWIDKYEDAQNKVVAAENGFNELTGGSYKWAQFRPLLDHILNIDVVYIGDTSLAELKGASDFANTSGEPITATIKPGSGAYADIADLAGDMKASISMYGQTINFNTVTLMKPVYLVALNDVVQTMEAADGGALADFVDMQTTYGYAVDLAFRCNAPGANLLLQTDPEQRVYSDSESARTMGGGSYMEFSSRDENLTLDQKYQLMDAIRVSFIDDKGNILGIAKLNTSNTVVKDGKMKASLYLYSYDFVEEEDGTLSLQMRDRQKTGNTLTSLAKNVAKAVTVIVWLDGDLVDNTMVSASEETSLDGILNLQFASSADLIPGQNKNLANITSDKSELKTVLAENKNKVDAGQKLYTTVSWNAYIKAYNYAQAVYSNPGATEAQIYKASTELAAAQEALVLMTHDTLEQEIAAIRKITGKTDELVSVVVYDKDTDSYIQKDTYTEEQKAQGAIYRVDYNKNLKDEGNDLKTQIYTDESWEALAVALYAAEYTNLNQYATNAIIDDALVALKTAYDALERKVFYLPFDYNGTIYYHAVSEEQDTYGKWYDYAFKRVINELLILNLDAKAVPVNPIEITQNYYVANNAGHVTPSVSILSGAYPELKDQTIRGLRWNLPGNQFSLAMTTEQIAALTNLVEWAKTVPERLPVAGDNSSTGGESGSEGGSSAATVEETVPSGTNPSEPNPDVGEGTDPDEEEVLGEPNPFYRRASGLAKQGQSMLDIATTIPTERAAAMIEALAQLKVEWEENQKDPNEQTPEALMTSNQRTVLIAAANAAKNVAGYSNQSNVSENMVALRAATAAVDAALADANTTVSRAETVLEALNKALVDNGQSEVTAYNTLMHEIPVSENTFEVVYTVDNPHSTLVVNGGLGEAELSVVILTDSGVVFTTTKKVMLYSPAEGSEINRPTNVPGGEIVTVVDNRTGETSYVWDGVMEAGKTATFAADLINRTKAKLDSDGHEVTKTYTYKDENGKDAQYVVTVMEEIAHTEKIMSFQWASSDTKVMEVAPGEDDTCVLKAVKPGKVTISVTVITEQGNKYATSVDITVHDVEIGANRDIEIGNNTTIQATVSDKTHSRIEYVWTVADPSIAGIEKPVEPEEEQPEGTVQTGEGEESTVPEAPKAPEIVQTLTNSDGICKIVTKSVGKTVLNVTATMITEITETTADGETITTVKRHNVYTNSIEINVTRIRAMGASLNANQNSIEVGGTVNLSAGLLPTGKENLENATKYEWSVDNADLVTLVSGETASANNSFTAKAPGEVKVTVKVTTEYGREYTATKTITIQRVKANGVKILPEGAEVEAGKSLNLSAELFCNDTITHIENATAYTWTVDDPNYATITPDAAGNCKFEAAGEGSARVTVTVQTEYGNTYTADVTVIVKPIPATETTSPSTP